MPDGLGRVLPHGLLHELAGVPDGVVKPVELGAIAGLREVAAPSRIGMPVHRQILRQFPTGEPFRGLAG